MSKQTKRGEKPKGTNAGVATEQLSKKELANIVKACLKRGYSVSLLGQKWGRFLAELWGASPFQEGGTENVVQEDVQVGKERVLEGETTRAKS